MGAFLAALGVMAWASAAPATLPAGVETRFLIEAATESLAGIELAKLATQRASKALVRELAARLVAERDAISGEVTRLARAKAVDLPSQVPPARAVTRDRLMGLSGEEFDRAWLRETIADQRLSIAEFERHAGETADADVKAWTLKTLPILKEHLRRAQALGAQLATSRSSGASASP